MSNAIEAAIQILDDLVCTARQAPQTAAVAVLGSDDALRSLRIVAETDLRRFELFLLHLQQAGVRARDVLALRKVVRTQPFGSDDKPEDTDESVRIVDVLPDAPVGSEVVVPRGWDLSERGIHTRTDVEVLRVPLVIASRSVPLEESDAESVTLAWRIDGRWRSAAVDRVVMASAPRLVRLADLGLPITAKKAQVLVDYLEEFDHVNRRYTSVVRTASTAGWVHGGRGFVWGDRCISDGTTLDGAQVVVACGDSGSRQALAAMESRGSFERWAEAIAPAMNRPRVAFALYAGLVPPLLRVVNASSFLIDFSGPTSGGKTTLLRMIASLWGNPDETSAAPYIRGWDLTRTFVQRLSGLYADHPLLLDDTQRADPRMVERIIYDVAGGQGRGRATAEGLQASGAWKTVLFSTGEKPLVTFSAAGGVRGRVISFWGSPFADGDAQVVRQLNGEVIGHFGHAGPRFVRFLIERFDQWDRWRERHRDLRQQLAGEMRGNAVADRHADYLASVRLSAELAHDALDLPWDIRDVVAPVWADLVAGWTEANDADRALDHLRGWLAMNQHRFLGQGRARGRWLGKWKSDSEYVDVLPSELKAALASGGYNHDACIRAWADAGLLILDSSGRRQVPTKLNGVAVRAVRFRKAPLGVNVLPEDDKQRSEIASHSAHEPATPSDGAGHSGLLGRIRAAFSGK